MFHRALKVLTTLAFTALLALPANANETTGPATEPGWTVATSQEMPDRIIAGWYTTELGRPNADKHWAAIWIDDQGQIIRELSDYCTFPGLHYPNRGRSIRVGHGWFSMNDLSSYHIGKDCPASGVQDSDWQPISWKSSIENAPKMPAVVSAALEGGDIVIDAGTIRVHDITYVVPND